MTDREIKYAKVFDSNMAYVEDGVSASHGPTAVFVHGNPTSSYLWRNVTPHVTPHIRCIAVDLIGFGYSDHPAIAYRAEDHARYFAKFIEMLELEDIVFVLHDWGCALGLDWARRHPAQVRGLAFMEFLPLTPTWLDLDEAAHRFYKRYRDPQQRRQLIIEQNTFVEQALPNGVIGGLPEPVMAEYRKPFTEPSNRQSVYQFPQEQPIAGEPADVYAMSIAYNQWLVETEIPKLFFYATPGFFFPPAKAKVLAQNLKVCRAVDLGVGIHYLPEEHPDAIGTEIASWLTTLE